MNFKNLLKNIRKLVFLMFMFFALTAIAQNQKTITGTVVADGFPLSGASVMAKGVKVGTATDFDGKFSLMVPSNTTTLVVSFLGYVTQEVPITGNTLSIVMVEEANTLGEVVITALGIKREQKALGYATQNVSGDDLQKVQGIDVATSLTGKVAGVLVQNSSEFNSTPDITILGEKPIIVIDGITYANKNLNDIAAEDIQDITFLKGATASALYGERGRNGAIMVTTKNGSESNVTGINVNLSSNTMFTAGYLAIPEKQSIYGRGENNTYDQTKDLSWGGLMDGSIKTQWDPITKEYRDYEYLPIGKDNFKNFLEQGYISNNNLNVTFNQKEIALRSSLNWTENKGRYPNSVLDKFSYNLGGDVNLDKLKLTSNLSVSRRQTPNQGSSGYTSYDPMYTLLIYSSADFNVLDYKDNYWINPGLTQNNQFGYNTTTNTYTGKSQNNPYFDRYERLNKVTRNIFNADITASYDISDWLKVTLRSGLDYSADAGQLSLAKGSYTSLGDTGLPYFTYRSGLTFNGGLTGAYLVGKTNSLSSSNDLMLTGKKNFLDDKFSVEYLAGGSIFYYQTENINATTVGGISTPGYFSLSASVSPASVAEERRARQSNSIYGRLAMSWNKFIYLDITGRNDWNSTMYGPTIDKSSGHYFYPSVAGSFVVSEFLKKDWLDLLKVRGSWTQSKSQASIYELNGVYTSVSSIWNTINGTYAPSLIYDVDNVKPPTKNTTEAGIQGIMYKKRLTADVSYIRSLYFDNIINGPLSSATGFTGAKVNTGEQQVKKGWLVALTGTAVKKDNMQWDLGLNWSTYKTFYYKLDDVYSQKAPWVKVGERVDPYLIKRFQYVPSGEYANQYVVANNGLFAKENFNEVLGYQNPDWIWGFNTMFKYKNWSLFASLDGVNGGLTKSVTENYMWIAGVHPDSTTPERALDVASPGTKNYLINGVSVVSGTYTTNSTTGEVITDTRVFTPNTTYVTYKDYVRALHTGTQWGGSGTEADILDGTFFKLREISLTYNIPDNLLNKWVGAKNGSISLIGQNVFLWSKEFKFSDPDAGGTTENFVDPSSRYIGANVKLSF